jgi:hypothetical protein
MNEHEFEFVMSFILREKRARYLQLLSKPKRRSKLLERLNHRLDIDYSFAIPFRANAAPSITALVAQLGAGPTCHVTADACRYDGEEMAHDDAVMFAFLHQFGILLSFIPGKLVFYKPESPSLGFVLRTGRARTDGQT